jgi:hypothetical protein
LTGDSGDQRFLGRSHGIQEKLGSQHCEVQVSATAIQSLGSPIR